MNAYADNYIDELDEDDFDLLDDFDEDDELDEFNEFDEDDEFLGDAWNWLTKKGSKQRRVALSAAKNAIVGAGGGLGGVLGTTGGPAGTVAGTAAGSALGGAVAGLLPDQMDYLADMAAEAEDEDEVEEFIGALVPLAARLLPAASKAVSRVAPRLISGVSQVAKSLHRNPGTRHLIRQLPAVVRKTTKDVARQYARNGRISSGSAARILARNTYRGIKKPKPPKAYPGNLGRSNPAKQGARPRYIRTRRGYCRCYSR